MSSVTRHGGPIVVLNSDGVRLGQFPTSADAEAWMGWQNAHSELRIRMRCAHEDAPGLSEFLFPPLERTVTT